MKKCCPMLGAIQAAMTGTLVNIARMVESALH